MANLAFGGDDGIQQLHNTMKMTGQQLHDTMKMTGRYLNNKMKRVGRTRQSRRSVTK